MARPAKKPLPDAPIADPREIQREVRRQRAMREHRERRTRERRAANIRFWVIVLALLALSVFLSVEIWQRVQNLFGL